MKSHENSIHIIHDFGHSLKTTFPGTEEIAREVQVNG